MFSITSPIASSSTTSAAPIRNAAATSNAISTPPTMGNSDFAQAIAQVASSPVDMLSATALPLESVFLNLKGSPSYLPQLRQESRTDLLEAVRWFNHAEPAELATFNTCLAKEIMLEWYFRGGVEECQFPQHIDEDGGLNLEAQNLLKQAGFLDSTGAMTEKMTDAVCANLMEHALRSPAKPAGA